MGDCEGTVFVSVPSEEGAEAVDSGQNFDATASAMFADVNGDRRIDAADLGVLLGEWNMRGAYPDLNLPDSDLDGDGRVLGQDMATLLREWNPSGLRDAGPTRVAAGRRR
jgi:hypothetical protein